METQGRAVVFILITYKTINITKLLSLWVIFCSITILINNSPHLDSELNLGITMLPPIALLSTETFLILNAMVLMEYSKHIKSLLKMSNFMDQLTLTKFLEWLTTCAKAWKSHKITKNTWFFWLSQMVLLMIWIKQLMKLWEAALCH
jgi:hypothetical protein